MCRIPNRYFIDLHPSGEALCCWEFYRIYYWSPFIPPPQCQSWHLTPFCVLEVQNPTQWTGKSFFLCSYSIVPGPALQYQYIDRNHSSHDQAWGSYSSRGVPKSGTLHLLSRVPSTFDVHLNLNRVVRYQILHDKMGQLQYIHWRYIFPKILYCHRRFPRGFWTSYRQDLFRCISIPCWVGSPPGSITDSELFKTFNRNKGCAA